jgi:mannitol-1-phosphate/altronate dehydrogenase
LSKGGGKVNLEGRVKKLEERFMSSTEAGDILTVAGDTIEELTQNAVKTIREAIRKGQGWDYLLLICPAELNDIDPVEQSIIKEFGRGPKRFWVLPKEALPEWW